jgi:hypothetical protein
MQSGEGTSLRDQTVGLRRDLSVTAMLSAQGTTKLLPTPKPGRAREPCVSPHSVIVPMLPSKRTVDCGVYGKAQTARRSRIHQM